MSRKTLITGALFLLTGGAAALPVWGGSLLNMSGAIVAPACDIDTASRDQTVDMGALTFNQIVNNNQATARPFSIRLVNCTLQHVGNNILGRRHFRVTFDGRNDDGRFGVEGEGRGVALVLSDAQGHEAVPGETLPPQTPVLDVKDIRLHYSARIVRNSEPLQTGTYIALVRYHLEYY